MSEVVESQFNHVQSGLACCVLCFFHFALSSLTTVQLEAFGSMSSPQITPPPAAYLQKQLHKFCTKKSSVLILRHKDFTIKQGILNWCIIWVRAPSRPTRLTQLVAAGSDETKHQWYMNRCRRSKSRRSFQANVTPSCVRLNEWIQACWALCVCWVCSLCQCDCTACTCREVGGGISSTCLFAPLMSKVAFCQGVFSFLWNPACGAHQEEHLTNKCEWIRMRWPVWHHFPSHHDCLTEVSCDGTWDLTMH